MSAPGYTIADTAITVGSTSNWPTDTGVVFAIDEAEVVDGQEVQVAGTYNEYIGVVSSGTSVTSVAWQTGVGDRNYASGALTRVYIPVSAERENRIVEWGLVHADQDGTLKAGAVDNAAVLASDVVTTAKIADDAVTDAKLDYPRWWQEIGRTTLVSGGDTITVSSLPARKYLKIIVSLLDTGGTIGPLVRFNNDTANNYARRVSASGGADGVGTSQNAAVSFNPAANPVFFDASIINIATQEKLITTDGVLRSTAGATTAPTREEWVGKWANTTDAINRIDVVNGGTGDFAIGSQIVVLGHD